MLMQLAQAVYVGEKARPGQKDKKDKKNKKRKRGDKEEGGRDANKDKKDKQNKKRKHQDKEEGGRDANKDKKDKKNKKRKRRVLPEKEGDHQCAKTTKQPVAWIPLVVSTKRTCSKTTWYISVLQCRTENLL